MFDSRKFWVGRGAGTAAERRLGLDDLHFESCASANDGRGQPIGPAADDGDVHRFITAQALAYSLIG